MFPLVVSCAQDFPRRFASVFTDFLVANFSSACCQDSAAVLLLNSCQVFRSSPASVGFGFSLAVVARP
jgi:hypothetical protein